MSEILQFLIRNFSRLTVFDFLIIVLFALVLTFSAIRLIKWAYQEVHEAQSKVIDLKEKEVGAYRSLLDQTAAEKQDLSRRLGELEVHARALAHAHGQISSERTRLEFTTEKLSRNVVRLHLLLNRIGYLVLVFMHLNLAYSILAIYIGARVEDRLPDAPKGIDLFRRLREIGERAHNAGVAVGQLSPRSVEDVFAEPVTPKILAEFDADALSVEANEIYESLKLRLDKVVESRKPDVNTDSGGGIVKS